LSGGNRLAVVIAAAALVRLAMFAMFLARGEPAFLRSNDSVLYLTAAENLLAYGMFSEQPGSPPPPTMLHLPGYPAVLALSTVVTAAPWFTAALQNIVSLLTVLLLFRLLEAAWGVRLAFWAALGYGVEPFTAYQANLIMGDALFVFLLLLGLHWYLRGNRSGSRYVVASSGVAFALATYIRVASIYSALLLALWSLGTALRRRSWHDAARALVLSAVVTALLTPWVVRNGLTFGVWKLSVQPNYTLYLYHANQALALREGKDPPAVRGELIAEMEAKTYGVRSRDEYMGRRAREILRQEWRSYVPLYLVKTLPFFLQSGWRDIVEVAGFSSGGRPVDLSGALLRGQWSAIASALRRTDVPAVSHLVGSAVWAFLTVLAAVAWVIAVRVDRQRFPTVLLMTLTVLLYALLASPLSHARYRQPVQPLIFALATYSALWLKDYIRPLGAQRSSATTFNRQLPTDRRSPAPAEDGADRA